MYDTIKKYLRLALAALLIAAAAFAAGRFTKPEKVVTVTDTKEVKVRDEEYTQKKLDEYRKSVEVQLKVATHTETKVLQPCPSAPVPDGTCKAPCATDCSKCPMQVISIITDTTKSRDSNTTTQNNSSTDTKDTSHETDTTHTVSTTTTTSGDGQSWRMSLIATGTLLDGGQLQFTPTYGAYIGHKLLGPVDLGVSFYTDKSAVGSLSLNMHSWALSAGAGAKFSNLSSPYFKGELSRQLLGPVWLSLWGTSTKTFGVAASFSVK
jgi:hypothetical protein